MIDINKIKAEVRELEDSIVHDEAVLANAVENNQKIVEINELYQFADEVYEEYKEYLRSLKVLYAVCNKKAEEYSQNRIQLLEQTVEENLAYIFPEENFKVKIDMDVSKTGRETCQLLLGKTMPNGSIKYSAPSVQNGRFVRQLISVVIVYSVNLLRGSKEIYLDEALASSDKENLTKLKPLLDQMRAKGVQVILVEHKHELYKNVTRKQFNLRKNRVTGVTVIENEEDIEEVIVDE